VRAHDRTIGGRIVHVPTGRQWTAEDIDLVEQLAAEGIPPALMARYFTDPTPTGNAIRLMMLRNRIDSGWGPGRISKADHARLDAHFEEWQQRQRGER
jgi:hypothetical protein